MRSLPGLRENAEAQLIEFRDCLSELPQALKGDASTEAFSLITEFSQEFSNMVYGTGTVIYADSGSHEKAVVDKPSDGGRSFIQKNRVFYQQFKIDIRRTAPNFRPFPDWKVYKDPFKKVRDEDDTDKVTLVTDPKGLYDVRRVIKRYDMESTDVNHL